ncbi:MAG: LysR family transcriptional regulator [Acidobacteriia bacterium]|nr:LysR family transcriptional regulator [Terriglobia bacterium]
MDTAQLKLFLDLARIKNFTRAARNNYLTQPAVSRRIQQLESELGVRLFERSRRRVLLSENGRIFLPYARDILSRLDEAREEMRESESKPIGRLKVAASPSIGLYVLPSYLKRFIRLYPKIDLHVEYDLPDRIYASIAAGDLDLGVVAYPVSKPEVASIPFVTDTIVLICAPTHPLARRSSVHLKDLLGHKFVLLPERLPTGKAIRQALRRLGVQLDTQMEYDNFELIKRTVEMGLGLSMVPRQVAELEVKNKKLRTLKIMDFTFERPLAIIFRKGRIISSSMHALLSILNPVEADKLKGAGGKAERPTNTVPRR